MLLADGIVVGCIFHAAASPVGTPWRWTLAFGHHEDSTPTHRLRADARGGDGGVCEKLTAGAPGPRCYRSSGRVGRSLNKGREIKSCRKRLDAMSDEMTLALGAFVTEVGDVEYVMFETILAVAEEEPNDVHRAFYNKTFGPKVTMLEKRLEHSAFDEHRAGLDHLIQMLKKLTSQRNNIIHGETFHISRRSTKEQKALRVGFTRKNLQPWKHFKNFEGNAKNIFTSDQIGDVITNCIAIKTDLDLIRQKVIKKLTGRQPPYLSHNLEMD
jgi:hypothetical protein